jgi:hypothetical protein
MNRQLSYLVLLAGIGLTTACGEQPAGPYGFLSETELRYRLDERFEIFFCDPDYYPVARGDELERAIETFPIIAADATKLDAIVQHLGLTGVTEFTPEQKLKIYREAKRLASIIMEFDGARYTFGLRAIEREDVYFFEGTIDITGRVDVRERTESSRMCPICLNEDTRIATANGDVRIRDLVEGTSVWTLDDAGRRVLAPVRRVMSVPLPPGHQFIRLRLSDGRILDGSPGHPTTDNRLLTHLAAGDTVDGAAVVSVERRAAQGRATWDLLPAGATGVYWANGVPLGTTLSSAVLPPAR